MLSTSAIYIQKSKREHAPRCDVFFYRQLEPHGSDYQIAEENVGKLFVSMI
jgi:hypothetical protein